MRSCKILNMYSLTTLSFLGMQQNKIFYLLQSVGVYLLLGLMYRCTAKWFYVLLIKQTEKNTWNEFIICRQGNLNELLSLGTFAFNTTTHLALPNPFVKVIYNHRIALMSLNQTAIGKPQESRQYKTIVLFLFDGNNVPTEVLVCYIDKTSPLW